VELVAGQDRPGVEPARSGLGLDHEYGRSLRATWNGAELFRYVFAPWDPQVESPRPYFHPLRTLGGQLVSLYRPQDHVWHKGLSLSLSNVGTENFWGGATYVRDHGYQGLDNNGTQAHMDFDRISATPTAISFAERLTWITQAGATCLTERREVAATVLPGEVGWRLHFRTVLSNVSGADIPMGSPTTEGRPDAGYSGLFWRGPRSFSGGPVITPDRVGADDLNGWRGPWMAFVGKHDGDGGASTMLFVDDPDSLRFPTEWFVRSEVFAVMCPAPFFSQVYTFAAGSDLTLCHDVVVADGALDQQGCKRVVEQITAADPLTGL
jgi:hypothetical protein